MSDNSSDTDFFLEAAGVKITNKTSEPSVKTIVLQFDSTNDPSSKNNNSSCGFHLTKTMWDAYPWVAFVEHESIANRAGLRPGDCLLNIDGTDVLGLKIKDIAVFINERKDRNNINLRIWRYESNFSENENTGRAWRRPLPEIVSKFANVFSECLRCLECPVCLERAVSPVTQCMNGHILCFKCKQKTSKCPICRIRLGQGRCLLAEKIWKIIFDIFDTNHEIEKYSKSSNKNLTEYLFGNFSKLNITETNQKNANVPLKLKRSLLTKLFHGNVEKAASTENIATVSQRNDELSRLISYNVSNNSNSNRLTLNDRPKSASTSQLSLGKVNREMDNNHELQTNITVQIRSLNLNWNLIFDGLNSSIIDRRLSCPFYVQKNCEIVLTVTKLVDHLIMCHSSKIIHIRGGRIKLHIPSPYGPNDVFLMHYMNNMFFLQVEEGFIWMIDVLGTNMNLRWTVSATGYSNTEMVCIREMAELKHPMVRLPKHIVFLPEIIAINTIDVKIIGNENELGICRT